MSGDNTNYNVSVQKLCNEADFETILEFNLNELHYWETVYPNHGAWIRKVVSELKEDTYARIAFGGFFLDSRTQQSELCCSAIVKKNPFSTHLEIKNFIVFKHNQGDPHELTRSYQNQLIDHIKKYAEQRGYSKLAIELLNRNKKDKELIRLFFENDFTFAGRQTDKYRESDEIVFLTCNINQIYGYDPYDNINAALWILKTYLKAEDIHKDNRIELITNKGGKSPGTTFTFFSNRKFDEPVKVKFNTSYRVLIIEEYFKDSHPCEYIREIEYISPENSRLYVFDFTADNIMAPVKNKESITLFNRQELEELMFNQGRRPKDFSLNYDSVGGLLLISNPDLVEDKPLSEIMRAGKKPVYIKLGSLGRYITEDMPLVFAYHSKKKNRLEIWACSQLLGPANIVNLKELREDDEEPGKRGRRKKQPVSLSSDGERLFYYISEMQDDDLKEKPIWSSEEFDKHNAYNETDQVIYFVLQNLKKIPEGKRVRLDKIVEDPSRINDPQNVFDFYLSKKECAKLQKSMARMAGRPAKKLPTVYDKGVTVKGSVKIMFLAAIPHDQERLTIEFDDVVAQTKSFPKMNLLNPTWKTNYDTMNSRLTKEKPHVLHLAVHGDSKGLSLHNIITNLTEPFSDEKIADVFEGRTSHLQIIILNACYSDKMAKKISKLGYYVIGFSGAHPNETANRFTNAFYQSFAAAPDSSTITKRMTLGIRGFVSKCPGDVKNFSLWKDEVKINYTTL